MHIAFQLCCDSTFADSNGHDGSLYAGNQQCYKAGHLHYYLFRELRIVKHIPAHYSVCVCLCECMHTFKKFNFWITYQNNFKSSSSSPMHFKWSDIGFSGYKISLTVSFCLFIFLQWEAGSSGLIAICW